MTDTTNELAMREALEAKHEARRELVAKHMQAARKEHRKLFGSQEYDSKVAEFFQSLMGSDKDGDLRQKAFGGDKVELSGTHLGGIKMRVHRNDGERVAQQKPYLEPQQEYADGEHGLPDQTAEQLGVTDMESAEEVSRTAPAPHTPDNLITKKPHEDGFSDLDKYGFTEGLEVQGQQQPKKRGRPKKHEEPKEEPQQEPQQEPQPMHYEANDNGKQPEDKGFVEKVKDWIKE